MPLAYIDHVDTLSIVEKYGVIRGLVRKVRVGFNDQDMITHQDYSRLSEAFKALDPLGNPVPAAYSTLASEGYDSLVLVERSAALVEQDPGWVDITLKYEHVLEGPNQVLMDAASTPLVFGKGKSSIVEKTTNFYYPFGDHTKPRVQIMTGHTFKPDDKGLVGQFVFGPKLPFTILEGGEISIPFPQDNFSLTGVLTTTSPWKIARQFGGCINVNPWLGRPPLTWICSEVQWEVVGISKHLYRFNFEFQYSVDTWDPEVVFIDARTGHPPANVRKGDWEEPTLPGSGILSYTLNPYTSAAALQAQALAVITATAQGLGAVAVAAAAAAAVLPYLQPAGYWKVPALPRVNFDLEFGQLFEGFPAPVIQ